MGAMVASIAARDRGNLLRRLLPIRMPGTVGSKEQPNLTEARAALKSIGEDGHRANGVITSISAMFKKNANKEFLSTSTTSLNDVLSLSRGELRSRRDRAQHEPGRRSAGDFG